MDGVVKGVIMSEGVPFLIENTKKLLNEGQDKEWLREINNWLIKAHRIMFMNQRMSSSYRKENFESVIFRDSKGNYKSGIGAVSRSKSSSKTMIDQWGEAVESAENFLNNNKSLSYENSVFSERQRQKRTEETTTLLMKQGYIILTKIGEAIRKDQVNYRIVVQDPRTSSFTRIFDYNIETVDEFANKATQAKDIFTLKTKDRLATNSVRGLKGKEWDAGQMYNFRLFVSQVRGYHVYFGKKVLHPLNIGNGGHILEAYVNSGFEAHYTTDKNYWKQMPEIVQYIMTLQAREALQESLRDPSPFWQGGEGGDYLGTTQMKGNYAEVTNLNTLVLQMMRVQLILNKKGLDIDKKVRTATDANVNLSDDEVVEALVNMFSREGAAALSVVWNI